MIDLKKTFVEEDDDEKDIIRDACIKGETPDDFDEEFMDKICRDCKYLHVEMGSHPGGSNVHSVEYRSCNLGYWADDF